MTASPDDQQELEKEIEQTRERLGETVEALAAKVDVKARAQKKLSQLTTRLKGKATAATRQLRLQDRAKQLRLQDKANQAKRQANQAALQVRKRPIPVAAAAGVLGVLVLFLVLVRRWIRRDQ